MKTKEQSDWMKGLLYAERSVKGNGLVYLSDTTILTVGSELYRGYEDYLDHYGID